MKLLDLIKNLDVEKIIGNTDVVVEDVQTDSNQVGNNSLFICLKGNNFDSHDFAKQIERYGASAVICEKQMNVNITQIIVKDCRSALSVIASEFYGNVDKKMKLIAVIGTNGKTTTAHLIRNVLEKSGIKCGVIGTLGTFYGEQFVEPSLTTPDPIELNAILRKMYDSGVKTVVMEVSAHAIYYNKIKGLKFYAGIFTNFSQDHLDFFKDMQSYKRAKLSFFENNECEFFVTNSDDKVGAQICSICKKVLTYGIENPADVFAIDVEETKKGCEFIINLFDCVFGVKLNLIGKFNVYNALACACTCALLGVKPVSVIKSLNSVKEVEGRLEKIYDGEYKVFVDYAHTPDGLKKSLEALKTFTENRLISVFGCGGNRDVGKREQMGKISANIADVTVITSDNPRFEEPMDIIRQIEKGVLSQKKKFISIEDRKEAIFYALGMARSGDIVIISGKGSEKYQEVLGIKKPYNDKDTVNEFFRSKSI